jgi:DNA-binding PucR family transcriptional regulator
MRLGEQHDRQQEQREQYQRQLETRNLQAAASEQPANPDFVEQIVSTGLEMGTAEMLRNLLQSDWVLGNLDDAEVHEARWLARTISDEVYAMHPGGESIWCGDVRAYASGNPNQELSPLSSAQRTKIFQLIQAFTVRVTRSEDMEQQEIFRKSINESKTDGPEETSSSGWL